MTVEKRFKVVQSRRTRGWGILDILASEFGAPNFAPFGWLTNYGGVLALSLLTEKAAKLNMGAVQKGSLCWDRRELNEFE